MSSILDKVSNEILISILRIVRNASSSGHFIKTFTVCPRWKELGAPLLWADIVLTNATIGRFVEQLSAARNSKHPSIRAFTLNLHAIWPSNQEFGFDPVTREWPNWMQTLESRNPRTAVLLDPLCQLADLMKTNLQTLNTFSLHIEKDPMGG